MAHSVCPDDQAKRWKEGLGGTLCVGTKKSGIIPKDIAGSFIEKLCVTAYSWVIASAGQAPTQAPQSTHSSAFTTALPSFMEIALTGQVPTQASQATHFSESTFAAISSSPSTV